MGTPFCVDPAPGGVALRSSRPTDGCTTLEGTWVYGGLDTHIYVAKHAMRQANPGVERWGWRVCWGHSRPRTSRGPGYSASGHYCMRVMELTRHTAPSRSNDTR